MSNIREYLLFYEGISSPVEDIKMIISLNKKAKVTEVPGGDITGNIYYVETNASLTGKVKSLLADQALEISLGRGTAIIGTFLPGPPMWSAPEDL